MDNDYKIIAKRGNLYLAVKNNNLDLSNIYDKAFIINEKNEIVLDSVLIGSALNRGYWEPVDFDQEKYKENENVVRNALIGAAVGDAFGVPYEFLFRETTSKVLKDEMLGCDTHMDFYSDWGDEVPAGSWSDDTSMIVATMSSMIKNQGIDYEDIMEQFLSWINENKYTSIDKAFGLGGTVEKALARKRRGIDALECGGKDFQDNGNGSLMRILPFSLFCIMNNIDNDEMVEIISNGSALTHGNDISKMACVMYTVFLKGIINTKNKDKAYSRMKNFLYEQYFDSEVIKHFSRILYDELSFNSIKESGYVVDTLEGVLYSVMYSNNYEDTIKKCVRIGYDTDTLGCIAGSIAGTLYGHSDIPRQWLDKLKKQEYLDKLSKRFMILDNVYEREQQSQMHR